MVAAWTPGERLFAQYAHAPNALGYCGPEAAGALLGGARGEDPPVDVCAIARRFSGAWPYQQIIADLSCLEDPLNVDVVRSYWTGNDVTRSVWADAFGTTLLDRLRPQAGHYWAHLAEDLIAEAAPTHAFHVLAVYPWSRLLDTIPDALGVIESCRIGWGVVRSVGDGPSGHRRVEVRQSKLGYAGELELSDPEIRSVVDEGFTGPLEPGDVVAVHWGRVCDRLTADEAAELDYWTRWQLAASNPRIRAAAASG